MRLAFRLALLIALNKRLNIKGLKIFLGDTWSWLPKNKDKIEMIKDFLQFEQFSNERFMQLHYY